MKRLIPKFNLFLVLLLLLLGCSNLDPSSKPQKSWLFAHIAIQAEILNETTIVMPVTGKIIAFTTEPFHKHAALSGEQFALLMLDAESKSFKTGPRNAILSWLDEKGTQEVRVVVTGAKISGEGKNITYTTEALPNINTNMALTSPHLYLDRHYAEKKYGKEYREYRGNQEYLELIPREFKF
ncbi:MAG: hypothetical protein ACKJRN_09050 [Porticoccaceae bacterium]